MNASETESEASHEAKEHNEHSQEEVAEDTNVIDEVDVSDTEVIETEIYAQDNKKDFTNRSNDS